MIQISEVASEVTVTSEPTLAQTFVENEKLAVSTLNIPEPLLEEEKTMAQAGVQPESKEEVKKETDAQRRSSLQSVQATRYLFNSYFLLGVVMPKKFKIPYVLYSVIMNFIVVIWLPLAFLLSYAQISSEDLDISSLLTSAQVALNVIGSSSKFIIMAILLPKLRKAHKYMDLLDERCQDKDELEEVRKLIKIGNRFVVYFAISYWSYSTSTFLGSVFFGRPPYSLYNPFFDWRGPKWEFLVASFMEYVPIFVACFQQVVDDSYAVIYVSILRTHMKILSMRIKKLATKPDWSSDQNLEELKLCIIDHKHLLGLYNVVAPIISVTLFIQFMITATLLGATLLNILIFTTKLSMRVASGFYMLAVVVEIFPLCYYAQCLMEDSERLATHIFHSNWVYQDMRFRKMLVVFMQHTQRQMELTAGKIFPITLVSFLSIAKFSFSLYTFMEQMNIKEKFGVD